MKRKDLYNYIKEEIVSALTEDGTALVTSKAGTKSVPFKSPSELDTLKRDSNVSSITTTSGQKIKEGDLEEMANIPSKIKIQDQAKFALAKEIYTSGNTKKLLDALEAAGENGLTQGELADAIGVKNSSVLNPIIVNLRTAGVLSPKREKAGKPEKVTPEEEPELPTLSPEEEPEEETTDDWEKPEEEETSEEEPTAVSDKEVEKTIGKAYAELSPEEEKLFNTYKTAIVNKVKVLNDKKASAADKAKAKAAIDNYKTKEDVRKVFTKKGLKLIDFINGELNK